MLALLGGAVTLADPPPSDDDWYANLLWLERRKCLLLTHAGTLFSAFAPDVRAADLRRLGPWVSAIVERELRSEGMPPDALGSFDPDSVQIAKTASRSVLGFMNDMATHIDYAVAAAGGLGRCDIDAVNRQLRRTPYNRGGFVYPIDLVVARVTTHNQRREARSQSTSSRSVMLPAATPSIVATVSSTDVGAHSTPFRARNSTNAR